MFVDFFSPFGRVLAENVVHLLKKYPEILYDQASEIKDFLISPRNISGREEFFANLVKFYFFPSIALVTPGIERILMVF